MLYVSSACCIVHFQRKLYSETRYRCVNILLLSSTKIGRCPYCRELFVATDVRRLHVTFDASATPKSPSLQSSEGARIRPTSYYATNPTAQNTAAYVQHNDRVDYIYEEDIQELYLLRRLAKAWVSSLPEQETTELLNSVDDWKHQPTRSLTKQGSKVCLSSIASLSTVAHWTYSSQMLLT